MRLTISTADSVLPDMTTSIGGPDPMMDWADQDRTANHRKAMMKALREAVEGTARFYGIDPEEVMPRPAVRDEYPHESADVTVLGPGVILHHTDGVINYKGENYYTADAAVRSRES